LLQKPFYVKFIDYETIGDLGRSRLHHETMRGGKGPSSHMVDNPVPLDFSLLNRGSFVMDDIVFQIVDLRIKIRVAGHPMDLPVTVEVIHLVYMC
jgi:hypothetical protein